MCVHVAIYLYYYFYIIIIKDAKGIHAYQWLFNNDNHRMTGLDSFKWGYVMRLRLTRCLLNVTGRKEVVFFTSFEMAF